MMDHDHQHLMDGKTILYTYYSAALLGYREDDRMPHFEDGVIEKTSGPN